MERIHKYRHPQLWHDTDLSAGESPAEPCREVSDW